MDSSSWLPVTQTECRRNPKLGGWAMHHRQNKATEKTQVQMASQVMCQWLRKLRSRNRMPVAGNQARIEPGWMATGSIRPSRNNSSSWKASSNPIFPLFSFSISLLVSLYFHLCSLYFPSFPHFHRKFPISPRNFCCLAEACHGEESGGSHRTTQGLFALWHVGRLLCLQRADCADGWWEMIISWDLMGFYGDLPSGKLT